MKRFLAFLFLSLFFILPATAEEKLVFKGEAYQELTDYQLPEEYYRYSPGAKAEIHIDLPDTMGRAVFGYAIVTLESISGQRRDNVSSVIPTGFEQTSYSFIDNGNLYDRCHLVAAQFANTTEIPDNIITGTHYMNISGMRILEDRVASYVQITGNSVFYSARPDFRDGENVCRGVYILAATLGNPEDFTLAAYCFNVQPGVIIDYTNGYSDLAETTGTVTTKRSEEIIEGTERNYILNIKSHVFHLPGCSGVATMKEKNKTEYHGTRQTLIEMGFTPCGTCNP